MFSLYCQYLGDLNVFRVPLGAINKNSYDRKNALTEAFELISISYAYNVANNLPLLIMYLSLFYDNSNIL